MRWSKWYIPTLKDAPADAEVISHKLLVRAGMIRKLTSGIYTYLPLGLRCLNKAAAIVREEMDRAGAQEILMPTVQPADLWKETGRWEFYGKELLRFVDRHNRDYCLGPTHEEVMTDLVRGEIRSYRQLPVNFYQIQTKFRDEIRPRFGLMRGREFLMKDAYSFDKDEAGAELSYKQMFDAYMAIFTRLGVRFRAVEADSGSIGGTSSHEFMVLAETGEDTIAVCTECSYAANVERAEVRFQAEPQAPACAPYEKVSTPAMHTVEEVCAFLKTPPKRLVKTMLFDVDGKAVAILVRGDHTANDIKVKNMLHADSVELASPEQVQQWTKAPLGFAGPVGLDAAVTVYADNELHNGNDWIVGANAEDAHLVHVDLARDAHIAAFADLRLITENDPCPRCNGKIELPRGIEVGHVFKLGLKYSKAMNANFLDENGKEQTMIMGCYGIGVSRVVAAAIEQNNDAHGMLLPPSIAPFEVVLVNLDIRSPEACAKSEEIYDLFRSQGIDTLLDDRDERPGFKFKDADLIGLPMQVVVGGKGLARGIIEVKDRRTGEKTELPVEDFTAAFATWRDTVHAGWKQK